MKLMPEVADPSKSLTVRQTERAVELYKNAPRRTARHTPCELGASLGHTALHRQYSRTSTWYLDHRQPRSSAQIPSQRRGRRSRCVHAILIHAP